MGEGVVVQFVDIYFHSNTTGMIHSRVSLSTEDIAKALGENGIEISNLDYNIDAIAVVANNNEEKDLSIPEGGNIYHLFTKELNVAHEQILRDITLYEKTKTLIQINHENSIYTQCLWKILSSKFIYTPTI